MSNNWAFIVGINQYDHQPHHALRFAVRDAELMRDFLVNQAHFPAEQVICCLGDAATRHPDTYPTCATLLRWLTRELNPRKIGSVDRIWFYFSGHGVSQNGRDYLLAADTLMEDLQRFAVPVDEVIAALRLHTQADIVLILDACREQMGAKNVGNPLGKQTQQLAQDRGIVTIFSCDYGQYSYELADLQHGAFTYALVEALQQHTLPIPLEQQLQQRVRELHLQTPTAIHQTPKIRLDSAAKALHPLLPDSATVTDITSLSEAAREAELEEELEQAKALWWQVIDVAPSSTQRAAARRAIDRIDQKLLRRHSSQPSEASTSSSNPDQMSVPDVASVASQPSVAPDPTTPKPSDPKAEVSPPRAPAPHPSPYSRPATASSPRQTRTTPASSLFASRRRLLQGLGLAGLAGLGAAIRLTLDFLSSQSDSSQTQAQLLELSDIEPEIRANDQVTFSVVTVDAKGEIADIQRKAATYQTEDLGDGVMLDTISIPGGRFLMGAPESEEGSFEMERPQHLVTVPSFFMGKYAVTQAQWSAVAALPQVARDLDANPSRFKGANRPIEQVSWDDAMEFCERLSQKTGKPYRLPSEAEWEYACRAGTTTPFHFGETITTELANYDGNQTYGDAPTGAYRRQTTDVGTFSANAFGLYDMHGNVWEWCLDHWHDIYSDAPTDGSPWLSSNENSARLLRGGSWSNSPRFCRSAVRFRSARDYWDVNLGFRVVCGSS
ncbi:MAG: SUMF1/EgtB/PvdO family nonheme iron enzyme [Kaiparowitsia implicata GSE-PSE-MK54-09C]|jgi:formylglycine-generating enzyme required for sulfatase activity/uncharacterized caspase-like protein|nr:SUMF1/EgtB/PvdO family nonheme iron enzyme [Kaiparowitsia implicata GSE-PSE-MK54-09C]